MGIFAALRRTGVRAEVAPGADRVEHGQDHDARFDAVGERLAVGRGVSDACVVAGRDLARAGADLGAALDGLRATYARAVGGARSSGCARVVPGLE